MSHDTGVLCTICKKANIVAEVEDEPIESPALIPIGPGSQSYYRKKVKCFHCSDPLCLMMFFHPPGKPDAEKEILAKIAQQEEV